MIELAVVLALAVDPSVKPWPIGLGPSYRPAATGNAVAAGTPIGELRCGDIGTAFDVRQGHRSYIKRKTPAECRGFVTIARCALKPLREVSASGATSRADQRPPSSDPAGRRRQGDRERPLGSPKSHR